MNIIFGIIIGLFSLMLLVTAHEFGHFLMARKNGVNVLEFGICFPPRAIAWKKGKDGKWHRLPRKEWDKPQDSLIISLNWLPIGGFCQMDGESAEDSRRGTFGKADFWAKTKILFGGVLFNWAIAAFIFTILAWTGMPHFLENQFQIDADTTSPGSSIIVAQVEEDSPADNAGIKSGDIITQVGQTEDDASNFSLTQVSHPTEISEFNKQHAGEEVIYTIEREGSTFDVRVTLNNPQTENGHYLGVVMTESATLYYSTWSAPIVGIGTTVQLTAETFKSVGVMLWDLGSGIVEQFSFDSSVREEGRESISEVGDSVSGPIGIVGILFPALTNSGITYIAYFVALISVSLACMNVLPIPALDGGRWLLITYYKLRKKALSKETEERIISRAFRALLIVAAIVTILDITRFF